LDAILGILRTHPGWRGSGPGTWPPVGSPLLLCSLVDARRRHLRSCPPCGRDSATCPGPARPGRAGRHFRHQPRPPRAAGSGVDCTGPARPGRSGSSPDRPVPRCGRDGPHCVLSHLAGVGRRPIANGHGSSAGLPVGVLDHRPVSPHSRPARAFCGAVPGLARLWVDRHRRHSIGVTAPWCRAYHLVVCWTGVPCAPDRQ
jgi:hypothetical protein